LCQSGATTCYPLIQTLLRLVSIKVWYCSGHVLLGIQARIRCWLFVIHRWVGLQTRWEFLTCLLKLRLCLGVWRGSIHSLSSSFSGVEHSSLILYFNVNRIIWITFHLCRSSWILSIRFGSLELILLHIDSWGGAIHCIIHHARLVHVFLPIYIERILGRSLLSLHISLRGSISFNCSIPLGNDWPTYYS
jgi:hypothetical protein